MAEREALTPEQVITDVAEAIEAANAERALVVNSGLPWADKVGMLVKASRRIALYDAFKLGIEVGQGTRQLINERPSVTRIADELVYYEGLTIVPRFNLDDSIRAIEEADKANHSPDAPGSMN